MALNWHDGENRSDEYWSGSGREVERLQLCRDAIPDESVSLEVCSEGFRIW